MAPNVDTLIVDHKETFKDLLGSVEVDSVTMSNVLIIFHVMRSCMIVANGGSSFFLKDSVFGLSLFFVFFSGC